jgi:hypothetical protein
MKFIEGFHLIKPNDTHWRPYDVMKIRMRIIWNAAAAKINAIDHGGIAVA